MQPPMIGNWVVRVNGVKPFAIHSDLYYELQVERTDEPSSGGLVLRVAQHATVGEPTVGQLLVVRFLMGQVTSAKPAPATH